MVPIWGVSIVVLVVVLLVTRRTPIGAVLRMPFILPFVALGSIGDFCAVPLHLLSAMIRTCWAIFATLIGDAPSVAWRAVARELSGVLAAARRIGARCAAGLGYPDVAERWRGGRPVSRPVPAGAGRCAYPFEDRYRVEGRLGAGGSTARLFVVRRMDRDRPVGGRLVLKYFDIGLGSQLDELVRESRGMQVAKEMGIVLDHRLERDHFYYVMPFYEGETLTGAAGRIHRRVPEGAALPADDVETLLARMAELLRILDGWHRRGVIHKDVKPDNVIVTEDGVRLVDLGLLTPLTSALTLTTHGTEYFRDPEMVKLAVKGVKVRDVDAARFDVYSAGAVLYFLLEGSFPACGPLSRFTRPVPLALGWIVSRAMAEGAKRYPSVAAMRADLEAATRLAASEGGYDKVPASRLPSFTGFDAADVPEPPPMPAFAAPRATVAPPSRPNRAVVRVVLAVLVAATVAAVIVTSLRVVREMRPASVLPAIAHPGPEAAVVVAITGFRGEIARALAAAGEDLGRVEKVPVLVVTHPAFAGFYSELARKTREALRAEGVPVDESVTREDAVRLVLVEGVAALDVQGALAVEAGRDELPMVLWISRSGLGAGRARLRAYYRNLSFETEADLGGER